MLSDFSHFIDRLFGELEQRSVGLSKVFDVHGKKLRPKNAL